MGRIFVMCIGVVAMIASACAPAAAPASPTAQPKAAAPAAGEQPKAAAPAAGSQPAAASASASAEWEKVVEAAKKEGKVTIYGQFDQAVYEQYIAAFNSKYPGIEVEVAFSTGPQAAEKIRTEVAAGKVQGDMWRSFTDPALLMARDGILEQWRSPSLVNERDKFAFLKSDEDEGGFLSNVAAQVSGIMINTNVVKEADAPTSWYDLADPKYKGKILWSDPRRPGGGQSMTWAMTEKDGQKAVDFFKIFSTQDLVYEVAAPKMAEDVARGEYGIGAPSQWTSYLPKQAPQTKFIQPKEGLYYSIANAVIPKGAPHPNAAKLWIEWETSKEGQQLKADLGYEVAIRTDVTTKETWLRLDTAGPWAGIPFADRLTKQADMNERVKGIYTFAN
ncbi:MAG: ABC transporter substrate-binding protein [Chloroflexota bacterium]